MQASTKGGTLFSRALANWGYWPEGNLRIECEGYQRVELIRIGCVYEGASKRETHLQLMQDREAEG